MYKAAETLGCIVQHRLCATEQSRWRPPLFQTGSSALYMSWTGRVHRSPQSITCYCSPAPHFCLNKSNVVPLSTFAVFQVQVVPEQLHVTQRCVRMPFPSVHWRISKEYRSSFRGHSNCSLSHFPPSFPSSDSTTPSDGWWAEQQHNWILISWFLQYLIHLGDRASCHPQYNPNEASQTVWISLAVCGLTTNERDQIALKTPHQLSPNLPSRIILQRPCQL